MAPELSNFKGDSEVSVHDHLDPVVRLNILVGSMWWDKTSDIMVIRKGKKILEDKGQDPNIPVKYMCSKT